MPPLSKYLLNMDYGSETTHGGADNTIPASRVSLIVDVALTFVTLNEQNTKETQ